MPVPSILHKSKYITPRDVSRMILRNRRVCKTGDYLTCLVQHNEARNLATRYADLLQKPELCDPEAFVSWYRANHHALNHQKMDALDVHDTDVNPEIFIHINMFILMTCVYVAILIALFATA